MAKLVTTGLIGSSSEKKKKKLVDSWHSRSLGSVQFSLAVQILDVQFGCSNFGRSSCSSISDVHIAFFLFWLPINPCSPLSATWKCLWLIDFPVVLDWTCPFQVDKNHQCYVDPFWLTELYRPILRPLVDYNPQWWLIQRFLFILIILNSIPISSFITSNIWPVDSVHDDPWPLMLGPSSPAMRLVVSSNIIYPPVEPPL